MKSLCGKTLNKTLNLDPDLVYLNAGLAPITFSMTTNRGRHFETTSRAMAKVEPDSPSIGSELHRFGLYKLFDLQDVPAMYKCKLSP